MCAHTHTIERKWISENESHYSILSFFNVNNSDWTQFLGVGSKCLCMMSTSVSWFISLRMSIHCVFSESVLLTTQQNNDNDYTFLFQDEPMQNIFSLLCLVHNSMHVYSMLCSNTHTISNIPVFLRIPHYFSFSFPSLHALWYCKHRICTVMPVSALLCEHWYLLRSCNHRENLLSFLHQLSDVNSPSMRGGTLWASPPFFLGLGLA